MSTADPYADTKRAWDWFVIEVVIVKNYNGTAMIGTSRTLPNLLLERVLVSLLTINLTSVLDDALEAYIAQNRLPVKSDKLADRIKAVSGIVQNAPKLHKLRKARNDHAHTTAGAADVTKVNDGWNELEDYKSEVAKALRDDLKILGPPHSYAWFFERSPTLHNDGEIAVTQSYRFGVRRDSKDAAVSNLDVNFHRPN